MTRPRRLRVLVTRPAGQAAELSASLRRAGCDPVEVPAIAIAPPPSYEDLDRAIARLENYDWILLTSRNAVAALFSRLPDGVPERAMPRLLWAAIGPGTAASLAAAGVTEVWTPSRYMSDAVAAELPIRPGQRVLRLRAQDAADLAEPLRTRGAGVDDVVVYRTVEAPEDSVPLLRRAWAGGIDAVVLASASAARGLVALAHAAGCDGMLARPVIAIGPVTAAAAAGLGLDVEIVADKHSAPGIAAGVRRRLHNAGHVRTS